MKKVLYLTLFLSLIGQNFLYAQTVNVTGGNNGIKVAAVEVDFSEFDAFGFTMTARTYANDVYLRESGSSEDILQYSYISNASTLTFNPPSFSPTFKAFTTYEVYIKIDNEANYNDPIYYAVANLESNFDNILWPNNNTGIIRTFTTGADNVAPSLSSVSPEIGETGVVLNPIISLNYNETLFAGTGNIEIREYATDNVVTTIPANTLTFNNNADYFAASTVQFSAGNLASNTQYYIYLPAGVVVDQGGNPNTAYLGNTLNFTTGNNTNVAPTDINFTSTNISENNSIGDLVGTFTAEDANGSDDHSYSLVAGAGDTGNSNFTISGDQLLANTVFDYEVATSHSIRVMTDDGNGGTFTRNITVYISNIADDYPVITNRSPEHNATGVSANTNISITFNQLISKGSSGSIWLMDKTNSALIAGFSHSNADVTGWGTNTISVDMSSVTLEPGVQYQISSNSGYFQGEDGAQMRINDNTYLFTIAPNSSPTNIILSNSIINENNAVNAVIGNLSSTDPDADNTFTYSLVSGTGSTDNASFNIDGNQLRASTAFNFESKNSYTARIRTTDQGGLFFEKQFTISIEDFNEAPYNLSLSSTSIDEGNDVNAEIGIFSAIDEDTGDTQTYEFTTGAGDDDNAAFNINGNELRANNTFDFETKSSYSILVVVFDASGDFDLQQFTIDINDVVENSTPTDISLSVSEINENNAIGEVIGQFSTTDADEIDTHTYSLVSGTGDTDNASFIINGANLKANTVFDFESKISYSIRVQSNDGNGGVFEKNFIIAIVDIDDTPPEIIEIIPVSGSKVTLYPEFDIVFNENIESSLLDNNIIVYRYSNNSSWWDIGDPTSVISVEGNTIRTRLTRGAGSGIKYYVIFKDFGIRDDAGNWMPAISNKDFYTFIGNFEPTDITITENSINENNQINDVIGIFNTTDNDNDQTHTYTLVAGLGDNDRFIISGNELKANAVFDFETKSNYSIRVLTDDGVDVFEKQFSISINDLSDNNPTDISISASSINENNIIGDVIGTFTTTDADAIDTHTYALVAGTGDSDNGSFTIAGSDLKAAEIFDFETKSSYSIRVQTDDGNGGTFEKVFTITINDVEEKQDQTISFDVLSNKVYGDEAFNLTSSASSGLAVSFEVVAGPVSLIGNELSINGTGSVTIRAIQSGNDDYNSAEPVDQSFEITKAPLTISADDKEMTFGQAVPTFTYQIEGFVYAEDESVLSSPVVISSTADENSNAGTYDITISGATADNYSISFETGVLTILKASQSINFDAISDVDIEQTTELSLTATSSSGLAISFELVSGPATLNGNILSLTGTGAVSIRANQVGNENYEAAEAVTQSFNVFSTAKQDQTITFDALADKVYGDVNFDLTATASSGLEVSFEVVEGPVSLNGNELSINGTGNVTIRAIQSGSDDFNPAAPVDQSFEITEAMLTVSADNKEIIYGEVLPDFTYQIDGFVNAEDESVLSSPVVISSTADQNSNAGTYDITVASATADNYSISFETGTLTILKASQVITFESIADVDIEQTTELSLSATSSSGLAVSFEVVSGPATLNGNTLSLTGTGAVSIRANQVGNENYEAESVTQSFNVFSTAKQDQTITFEALDDKLYGDTNFDITATASSGLEVSFEVVEGPVSLSGNEASITGTGNVTIRAIQSGNDDFNPAAPVDKSFEITKAMLTVSADNKEMIYGEALPDFTYQIDGFVYSEDESVLSNPVAINSAADQNSNAGTYDITVSGATANNYSISFETGTLTILKASQNITFESIADVDIEQTTELSLSATSTSGLVVSFEVISGPATLNGNTVSLTATGAVSISANQSGNENYEAAETVLQSFNVFSTAKEDQTITFEALPEKTFGDAAFELTGSASSGLAVSFSSSDESVATISGTTVSIVGAGTATITASQDGSEQYNPAPAVSQTLVVNKADQEITIESISDKDVEAADFAVIASTTSELELVYTILSGPATINGNLVSLTGETGTVEIEVSQAGDNNYNVASATTSFEVIEDPCQGFEANATVVQNISCNGDASGSFEVSINNGTAPFTFSTGNASQDNGLFENMDAGSYEIIVTDANGCSATATVEITEPEAIELTAETTDSNSILGNGSISLNVTGGTGSYTYDWSNGETTSDLTDLGIGEYSVTITDEAGCSITESFSVGGVTANSESFEINIYPNPVMDQVQIVHGKGINQITLIDAKGKIIIQQKTEGKQTQLEMKALPAGMYFIRLDNGKMNRIIKQ